MTVLTKQHIKPLYTVMVLECVYGADKYPKNDKHQLMPVHDRAGLLSRVLVGDNEGIGELGQESGKTVASCHYIERADTLMG